MTNAQPFVTGESSACHETGQHSRNCRTRGEFRAPGVGVLIGEDEPIPDLVVGIGNIPLDAHGISAAQIQLAVEVVSRSTAAMDRRIKPDLYAEGGIPNYWRLETSRFKGQLPGECRRW
ncbi:Uma2 family endonuclease [Nocardia tengchongensis]|uniref:Uma2 family endonuclease n=1 Tax=Nocardia tengchongensis TaxID=2055889 RepID=UPI003616150C